MRRSWIVVFLVATAIPLSASKHTTVAQLQQALNTAINAHKPDTEIAREIGGFELTERLTEATLGRLKARLGPGTQGARALELLADRSAFFDPPANELPATPAPDSAEQTRILQAARRYASQTLPRLPDFFATRVISLYDDRPQALKKDDWPTRSGLHLIDTSSGEISVRNERENQPATQGSAVWQANVGLISGGEFGNTLGMILADTANGNIRWSHWEDSAKGGVAVFRYEVPASASHYEVLNAVPSNTGIVHSKPGYHGSIGVSPADGTILRITMDADLTRGAPFRRAAILVEYGPVDIAGTTFTCPVRSIALSMSLDDPDTIHGDAPKEWLNETHFIHYHRFASTTRILAGGSAPPGAKAEPARTDAVNKSAKESAPQLVTPGAPEMQARSPVKGQPLPPAAESTSVRAANMQAPPAGASQPGSGSSGEPPSPASNAPAEPVTEQATSTVAANESPAFAVAPPGSVPAGGVTLHVEVPELLIPAVVRDKQGRAVGKLGQSDFTVFDQGKIRAITGFTVVKSAATGVAPTGAETGATAGPSVAVSGASATLASSQNRFILFLFDDRHLNSSDLAITQTAAIKMLDEPLAATDYEAVLSFAGVNSGITQDRALLQEAIKKLKVHRTFQHDTRDCPDIDYYAADKILNQHDSTEFAVAVRKAKACGAIPGSAPPESSGRIDDPTNLAERLARSAASRALAIGEEDARQSLLLIKAVVSAMSKLPGQRTLILVSPGFLSLSPEAMTFKSEVLDRAAGSNVVISALDARGLYVGNADASQGGNSTMSDTVGQTSQDRLLAMEASENAMAELAYGTGGTFFHNNNDLENGLKSLAAAPQYLYLLQVSLKDVKPTGTYHRLQVKVDQHGLDVQARRGYFAPKTTNRKQSGATADDRKN